MRVPNFSEQGMSVSASYAHEVFFRWKPDEVRGNIPLPDKTDE